MSIILCSRRVSHDNICTDAHTQAQVHAPTGTKACIKVHKYKRTDMHKGRHARALTEPTHRPHPTQMDTGYEVEDIPRPAPAAATLAAATTMAAAAGANALSASEAWLEASEAAPAELPLD